MNRRKFVGSGLVGSVALATVNAVRKDGVSSSNASAAPQALELDESMTGDANEPMNRYNLIINGQVTGAQVLADDVVLVSSPTPPPQVIDVSRTEALSINANQEVPISFNGIEEFSVSKSTWYEIFAAIFFELTASAALYRLEFVVNGIMVCAHDLQAPSVVAGYQRGGIKPAAISMGPGLFLKAGDSISLRVFSTINNTITKASLSVIPVSGVSSGVYAEFVHGPISNIPVNTETPVVFESPVTIPEDGAYVFTGYASWTPSGDSYQRNLKLLINGNLHAHRVMISSGHVGGSQFSVPLKGNFTAGDLVELVVSHHNEVGPLTLDNARLSLAKVAHGDEKVSCAILRNSAPLELPGSDQFIALDRVARDTDGYHYDQRGFLVLSPGIYIFTAWATFLAYPTPFRGSFKQLFFQEGSNDYPGGNCWALENINTWLTNMPMCNTLCSVRYFDEGTIVNLGEYHGFSDEPGLDKVQFGIVKL
jgi:hypothetical protein